MCYTHRISLQSALADCSIYDEGSEQRFDDFHWLYGTRKGLCEVSLLSRGESTGMNLAMVKLSEQ